MEKLNMYAYIYLAATTFDGNRSKIDKKYYNYFNRIFD